MPYGQVESLLGQAKEAAARAAGDAKTAAESMAAQRQAYGELEGAMAELQERYEEMCDNCQVLENEKELALKKEQRAMELKAAP